MKPFTNFVWTVSLLLIPSWVIAAHKDPTLDALNQQLKLLQTTPTSPVQFAYFLQAQAQQAIDAVRDGSSRDHDKLLAIAKERVEAASLAAKTSALQQTLEQLEKTVSQLQVESSQRQNEQFQQEIDRLKTQLQTQTQVTEQARQEAQVQLEARQNAEKALNQVAGKQQAHLSAARKKTVQLNHEEAELTSGEKLPVAHLTTSGEVFSVSSTAFTPEGALSPSGVSQTKSLAAYFKLNTTGHFVIIGYGTTQAMGHQRSGAIHAALLSAGVPATHLKQSARLDAKQVHGAEVVLTP